MLRIKTKELKYATKELNSSVLVFLDLTEPKRNYQNTEIYQNSSVSVVYWGKPKLIFWVLELN